MCKASIHAALAPGQKLSPRHHHQPKRNDQQSRQSGRVEGFTQSKDPDQEDDDEADCHERVGERQVKRAQGEEPKERTDAVKQQSREDVRGGGEAEDFVQDGGVGRELDTLNSDLEGGFGRRPIA